MSRISRKRRISSESAEPLTKRLKDMEDHLDELQRSSNDFSERIAAFCRNRRDEPEAESDPESEASSGEEDDESDAEISSEDDSDVDDISEAEEDEEYGRCLVNKKKRSVLEIRTSWECTKCQMETDDDEVDEADDDLDSSDDDDEENRDERDDSLWKQSCSWKCANCLKEICGNRTDRLKHIAVHNSFKIRCPLDGCNALLSLSSSKRLHLQRAHQIELGQLSQTQKRHFEIEHASYYKKLKEVEREFFPEENIGDVFKVANDTCKKCNTKVVSYPGQFQHVAAHLKLRIKCPLPECKSAVADWYSHLRGVHNLKLHELDKGVQELLKKSHMNKIRAVKKAKNKYF